MLRLHGVGYRYAGYATPVLRDIDLTLADREIVGVVGANEAGKSTLAWSPRAWRRDRSAVG